MTLFLRFTYLSIFIGLTCYAILLSQFYIKTELAILISFAERLLTGESMSDLYYEVNPPLSIIIFIPVVWIKNLLSIEAYYSVFVYTGLLIAACLYLTKAMLAKFDFIDKDQRYFALILFLIAAIFIPNFSFGDREHLIIICLVPFLLVQASLTLNMNLPKTILIPALILGSIAVLVKPHYGLIPTFILVHRFVKNPGLKRLTDKDFLVLSFGVLGYAAALALFFPDYITTIMPDVIEFYAPFRNTDVYIETAIYMTVFSALALICALKVKKAPERRIVLWLFIVTALFFVPYIVQAKGFDYHRIPWLFMIFISSSIYTLYLFKNQRDIQTSIFCTLLIILPILWMIRPVITDAVTHHEFKTLPLSQALDKFCSDDCSYLLLNDTADLIHQPVFYHDATHASRFTSMWYLLPLIKDHNLKQEGKEGLYNEEEKAQYLDKYLTMVADDFERFNPDVILALETLNIGDLDFNFIEFFSQNKDFERRFSHYQKVDTLNFERRLYFQSISTPYDDEGPVLFSVYQRKDLQK